jgi:hypothetical protein
MAQLYQEHGTLVLLAMLVIAITLLATVYAFWRKRFMDRGPRKGEAANPAKVRMQNPPDH